MNFSGIPRESLLGSALRAVLRLLPAELRVPILQGRLRGKKWIVGSGVHGYWLGSYEWEKRSWFERIVPNGGVVFDVGANVGFYTLLASGLVGLEGSVYSFEPVPLNLRYLKAHLSLNHVTNVTVFEAAVYDQPGLLRFDLGPTRSMGSVSSRGSIEVPAVTLDFLWQGHAIPLPDVIKMDIEGGEFRALCGATRLLTEGSPVILLATHGPDVHKACCDFLSGLGYQLTPLASGVPIEATDELMARK